MGEVTEELRAFNERLILSNLREHDASRNEIEVRTSTASDGAAVIAIRDTGPAIAEEVLPHVFDPFFMASASGFDLGLSVCRNLVLAMGGEIEVESRPRHGTTFRIRLPASSPQQERPAPAVVDAPARTRKAAVLDDDDEAIGVALRRIHKPFDAKTIRAAVRRLAGSRQ